MCLVAVLASVGCGGNATTTTTTPAVAHSLNNVAYATDPAQVMDVRLPAGRGANTPVVVFIHGGGWEGGDTAIFTAADLKAFAARGYTTVNINYRGTSGKWVGKNGAFQGWRRRFRAEKWPLAGAPNAMEVRARCRVDPAPTAHGCGGRRVG